MHDENKVMKKQLIGLLAKVNWHAHLPPHDSWSDTWILVESCFIYTFPVLFHQIVGASREELDDMGTA